jgi:hypothetical protein
MLIDRIGPENLAEVMEEHYKTFIVSSLVKEVLNP